MRPRIGITTSTLERTPEGAIRHRRPHISTTRSASIRPGACRSCSQTCPGRRVDEFLATLDGLLLSGGGDVDPGVWGRRPTLSWAWWMPCAMTFELALVRAALRRDLPLLGICRGMQVMAVAAGGDVMAGSTRADVPARSPIMQSLPRAQASHPVTLPRIRSSRGCLRR